MIPSLFVGEVLEVDPLSKGGSFHSLRRGGWMGSYRSSFNPFLIPYIPFWGEDDPLTFIELCFIPAPLHLICLLDWAWLCPEYLSTLSIFCNLHLMKHHFFCSIAFIWVLLYILSTFAPDNNALWTLDQNLSALRIFLHLMRHHFFCSANHHYVVLFPSFLLAQEVSTNHIQLRL